MKKHLKAAAGFTLVELIVVIAILGILAGVAVPVYSGYVKKANLAADQTLVDSINTAFASACIENGVDINSVASATLVIDDETKTVDVDASTLVNDDVKAAFGRYLGGEVKFKVLTTSDVGFDRTAHIFKIISDIDLGVYANLTFVDDLINRVKDSIFMTDPNLGVNNLMDRVDFVSSMAAGVADPEANNGAWQMLSRYNTQMLSDLGIVWPDNFDDLSDPEKDAVMAPLYELRNAKIALLDAQNGGGIEGWSTMTDEEKAIIADNAILSTYAVLDAASGMNGKTPDEILTKVSTTSNFKDMLTNTEDEDGVAVASAAYGLYTAYAHSLEAGAERDAAIAKLDNPIELMKGMDDPGFRSWIADEEETGEAEAALDAYMAAMEMIDASATNTEAKRNLIINGFTDPALLAVINQQMK